MKETLMTSYYIGVGMVILAMLLIKLIYDLTGMTGNVTEFVVFTTVVYVGGTWIDGWLVDNHVD